MMELKINDIENADNIHSLFIKKDYIVGWCVKKSDGSKSIIIYTPFSEFSLVLVPDWELEQDNLWDETKGRERVNAFIHNMMALEG